VILSQIHEMDYLYWFFGLPIQVYTVGGHLSHLEVDVEDVASTLMQFKTDGNPFPVYLHQDYIQRPPSRSFRIVGDEGRMDVDLNALSIQLYSGQGELIEDVHFETFQRNQLFLDELAHFLACVRGEVQPLVTLEDGLQSLRMALAARKSLETGKVVVI
jgi:predicted dehydrogenase